MGKKFDNPIRRNLYLQRVFPYGESRCFFIHKQLYLTVR